MFVISRTIAPPVRVAFAFIYAGYKLKFYGRRRGGTRASQI
jgi:hypothetical protein